MRLLRVDENGEFSLTNDLINNIPPYATLSHTWGEDYEEVSFKDLTIGPRQTKPGYKKLRFCAEQSARDGLQHFWVDTCCIDKSNSTELHEAIHSMFRWYRNAKRCYVYLLDVSTNDRDQINHTSWEPAFQTSRWFTRGRLNSSARKASYWKQEVVGAATSRDNGDYDPGSSRHTSI